MKELVLPVPERVSAAYIVPVTAPMTPSKPGGEQVEPSRPA